MSLVAIELKAAFSQTLQKPGCFVNLSAATQDFRQKLG
jgi:hypothetical protein